MRKILFAIPALAIICQTAVAQPRYDEVRRHNLWLEGNSVAGLRTDTLSVSYAEAYARYEGGGFARNFEQGDKASFGARMQSLMHLKRISFKGEFGFDYAMGFDMCGSMFTRPGLYPIDVAEFTPGRKVLETYRFEGGLQVEATKTLLLGLDFDITAQSYAKRKDLRHKNNFLDFGVMPSLALRFEDAQVALSYIYRKNSDRVTAGEYGVSSTPYEAFFSNGLWYGSQEVWEGSGTHLNETGVSGLPVSEQSSGVMFQASYKGLYADFTYTSSFGHSGEKDVEWHRFPSSRFAVNLGYKFLGSWIVKARLSCLDQNLRENVMRTTNVGGVSVIEKIGVNTLYSRREWNTALETEYYTPKWNIRFGCSYSRREELSTIEYPLWRNRKMWNASAFMKAMLHLGRFDLGLKLQYTGGDWSWREASLEDGVEVHNPADSMDAFRLMDCEWFTSSSIRSGVSLRYNIRQFYVEVEGSWLRAFRVSAIGANRGWAGFGVGYRF